jgi:hypothetical protein
VAFLLCASETGFPFFFFPGFKKIAELNRFFFFPPSACSVPERGGGNPVRALFCKRRLASAVNLTRKEMSGPGE